MTAGFESGTAPVVLAVRALAAAPPGVTRPAVRDVSFTLRRGEWFSITGPNGAGKSTLALALAGLWPSREGTRTVLDSNGELRIATILQEPATQITQRSVRDEIAFTALNLGLAEPAAYRAAALWAERLGLSTLLERTPGTLSAGQQQSVLIAAALAAEPGLLIADEAAAHLDAELRRTVLTILRERVDAGLALIWVTQDKDEIRCAGRLILIGSDGRCQERALDHRNALQDSLDEGFIVHDEASAEREGAIMVAPAAAAVSDLAAAVPTPAITDTSDARVLVRMVPSPGGRLALPGPFKIAIGDHGVWAIVGPNGSGKSSMLEALAGVEPEFGMEIEWRETFPHGPILSGQFPERQIFEEHVRAEVSFAALRRGIPAAEIEGRMTRMFAALALPADFPDRRTWELSTGEKRLVSLVATLLTPTSLVLLDEPTCGLDPDRRKVMGGCVREASARVPVVVATQDRAWIRQVGAIEVPLGVHDGRIEALSARDAKSQQKNGLTEPCNKA